MSEGLLQAIQYTSIPLPRKPRLTPWVVTVDLGDDRLQFRGAEFAYTLRQPALINAFGRLRPMLDGQHTVDEIAHAGGDLLPPAAVVFLLQMLRANGLIQEGKVPEELASDDPDALEQTVRFFSHFDVDAYATLMTLRQARVAVTGHDSLRNEITSALTSLSVGEIATEIGGKDVDFIIACAESPAFDFFDRMNQFGLENGARWMHVGLYGITARLGPTIIPYQTACYTCYDRRVRSLVADTDAFDAYRSPWVGEAGPPPEGSLAAVRDIVAGHVALEVARILTGFAPPTTIGRFHVLNPMTPAVASHDVPRLPRCPVCHSPSRHPEVWHEETIIAGQAASLREVDATW